MPRISTWGKLAAVGLVCYLAAAVFVGGDARGQKDDKDKGKKDKGKGKKDDEPLARHYAGFTSCRQSTGDGGCHNRAKDDPFTPDDRDVVCRCNEIKFWLDKDKHASAYRVLITEEQDAKKYVENVKERYLKKDWDKMVKEAKAESEEAYRKRLAEEILEKNARAKQMVAILRKAKDKKKDEYKLTTDLDCLACHAQAVTPEDKKAGLVAKSYHPEEGVNCLACHGTYNRWTYFHFRDNANDYAEWRAMDRSKKQKEFGMTDLWDPVNRTRVCASCHVGSPGGTGQHPRFVTHEMYAAGHPPLPSFEVAAFSNEMPRHWDYLRDKNKKILEYQKINPENFQYEQAQLVLIGAAAALAESMRLIGSQADKEGNKTLDLSNFDCYACHHQLEKDAWRQQRGYGNHRPGRLPMRPWAAALVNLAVAYAYDEAAAKKEQETFEAKLNAVKDAFTSRMYGNPAKIKAATTDLQKWAEDLAKAVKAKSPNKEQDATRAYQMVPKVYAANGDPKKWIDFDSARQVGWGFKAIYFDVKRYPWSDNDLIQKGKEEKAKDAVVKQLAELDKILKLELPKAPKTIEDDLEATMSALNKYRPAEFNKDLEALGKTLPKK